MNGSSLGGRPHGLPFNPVGILATLGLAAVFSAMSYVALIFLGIPGLVVMTSALLGASGALTLAWRSPVIVFSIWLLLNSGFESVGMIRMPGLPDVSIVRMMMILVMVLMVLGLFWRKNPFTAPILPDVFLVLHTVYILLNAMFIAEGDKFHLWYVSSLSPMLGYFFAKQYFRKPEHIRTILIVFMLICTYYWFISIVEHFKVYPLIWPKTILIEMRQRWIGRSRGPFLQPALFGQVFGMYLLVHFFYLTRRISRQHRMLVGGNLALGALGLFFTYTRGGWLATLAGLLVMGALRPQYRKIVLGLAITGVLLGTGGLLQMADSEMLQERVGNTTTIESRTGVMLAAFQAIKQNPVFGVGYFMFRDEAHLYKQGAYVPGFGYIKKSMGDHGSIHEMYIGRAAEEGLFGMALWFGFVGAVAWRFRQRWRENPQGEWFNRDLIALMAAICVSYLVGGLAINFRFFSAVNILPYFVAGLVTGFPRESEEEEGRRSVAGVVPR